MRSRVTGYCAGSALGWLVIVGTLWAGGSGPPGSEEPDPKPRLVLPDESAYSASPQDGRGRVVVAPTTVAVRSPVTLDFVFTVDERGIAEGGGIICHVSSFWGWTPPQTLSPDHPGYVTARCSDPQVRLETSADRGSGVVVIHARDRALSGGQTVTLVYGDTSNGAHPGACGISDRYAERAERFYFKVDGDGDGWFVGLKEQPRFRVAAERATQVMVFGPSWARVGQPFELTVAVLDPAYNLVESFTGDVRLTAVAGALECPQVVTFAEAHRGAQRVKVTAPAPGVVRVAAADPKEHLVPGVTNPTLVSGDAAPKYTLYWADLQSHSNVSDGSGSPEDQYRYARDVARLDAFALTDHDHWGYRPLDEDPATWKRLLEVCKTRNEPGQFVTIPGYEWTNWTYGHRHVLFEREEEAVLFSWPRPESDHPEELWALLAGRACLTVSHHTGGGPIPTCWKYWDARFEPVVEMASVHGVSERMGHPRSIYSPVESGMVQSALARGYRLGLIGGGDTHDGHPGLGTPGMRAGVAGIYAKALTREAIFEALRARRVFATTGCRPVLRFHLGDVAMGGVVKLTSPDADRTFSLAVLGDAPIATVAIIKNNEEIASLAADGPTVTWSWTDPEPARDGDYYYARIRQRDNEWVWSSPIFVELAGE
ncbi:MAG: CehA/McbA family metallohydrolase [bacterium]|nr:CehA/McbA family metallohydrolase [bacterium]